MVRATLLLACLSMLSIEPRGQEEAGKRPAPNQVREGFYLCTGDSQGKEYECVASIKKEGEAYIVRWLDAGQVGIGMQEGSRFTVGWSAGPTAPGVSVFKIEAEGKLVGHWATGAGVKNHETLEFLRGFSR